MKSQAQRAYLWATHPELAKEFEAATPKGKDLPEHVKRKARDKRASDHMNRLMRGAH